MYKRQMQMEMTYVVMSMSILIVPQTSTIVMKIVVEAHLLMIVEFVLKD